MKLTLAGVLLGSIAPLIATSALAQDPAHQDAAGLAWQTDFEKAKTTAKSEHKDLLLDFTGSDWCGWCIKLKEEVFDKDEFKVAEKDFVFVELDFPRTKQLSAELKAQNEKLQTRFAVQGFPTILLCDDQGMPYAQTGYQAGGPTKYLEHLAELRKHKTARDAAFAKAKTAKGIAVAQIYSEAYDALPEEIRHHYTEIMDRIIQIDADGKAGLKAKYEAVKAKLAAAAEFGDPEQSFGKFMQSKDYKSAQKTVETYLTDKKPTGENAQKSHWLLGIAQLQAGDPTAAATTFKKGQDLDPTSDIGQGLAQMAERATKMAAEKKPEPKKDDAKK